MLSGNGRHRRPRQAPALLVAAGVTGSAIAIPLLGATGASAATGTTWDQVAEVRERRLLERERRQRVLRRAPDHPGGLGEVRRPRLRLARRPGQPQPADSRRREDPRGPGRRLLADLRSAHRAHQGLRVGRRRHGRGGRRHVGQSVIRPTRPARRIPPIHRPARPRTSRRTRPRRPRRPIPPPSRTHRGKGDNSSKSDTPSESGSASEGSRQLAGLRRCLHRYDEAGRLGQLLAGGRLFGPRRHRRPQLGQAPRRQRRRDRHRHRHRHDRRGTSQRPSRRSRGAYTVRAGDTLESIADSLDLQGGWRALYAENKQAIGADPNLIVPGQTLDSRCRIGRKLTGVHAALRTECPVWRKCGMSLRSPDRL